MNPDCCYGIKSDLPVEITWSYKDATAFGNVHSVFDRWKTSTHKEGTQEELDVFYRHIFTEWCKGTLDLIVPNK